MANKIWVINQFANTPDLPGHTRQYELVKHLGEKNFEITVFASDFNLSERKFKKLNKFKLSSFEYIKNVTWNWLRVVPYKKNNWLRKINLMSFCFHLI